MTPLREIVHAARKALGITQGVLARRLEIDPATLSKILNGSAPAPTERAHVWAETLRLRGQQADDLVLAMDLANAGGALHAYIDQLEREAHEARRIRAVVDTRVSEIRALLDVIAAEIERLRRE